MEPEPSGATSEAERTRILGLSWKATLVLGLITFILGLIIAFKPSQSLNVIAVLLGVLMLVSGIYHIVRALDSREQERVWRGISGVLFLIAGVVLLRHLHLTIALIGLFIGFTWIVQGVAVLAESFSRGRHEGIGWSVAFGVISLIAGIVVVAAPISSIGALTIFMGIWFAVMGALEVFGSFVLRRAMKRQATEGVRVPGQRSGVGGQAATESRGTAGDSRAADQNTRG